MPWTSNILYYFPAMNFMLSLLLALLPAQFITDLEMPTLDFEAQAFKQAFNEAAGEVRIVSLMSPT